MNIKTRLYNILRKSEKYTKTDMVYLARGGFWISLGQTVAFLSAFLLAIAFANLLPQHTYGVYKYVLSIVGILTIPTLSGIGAAMNQAVARGYEGSFLPALKTKIYWGILGSLSSLLMAGYYFYQNNISLTISFLVVATFVPFMDSFGIYDSLLNGKKLFGISTKYKIVSQFVSIAFLITTLIFTKNLFLILLAYFLPWTILRFIFLKITLKKFPPNTKEDSETISYGKHLSFVGVVGTIATFLDRLLIFHYLGAVDVAVYSFAIAVPEQIKGLFKGIPTLALPKLTQRSFKEIDAMLFPRLLKLFLLGTLIALAYILIAPSLFKIFFPKYLDSILFSQLFAVTIALRLPISLLTSVGQSRLNIIPKKWLYWSIIPQIILIVSLLLLVQKYGILGAIVSKILFLVAILVMGLIRWKLVLKKYLKKINKYE